LSKHWHEQFEYCYNTPLSFGDLSLLPNRPKDSVTVCVLNSCYYSYFGSRRQHRVCQPPYVPSSDWMMNYSRQENVDFIVHVLLPSGLLERRYSAIADCIASYPDLLLLTFEDHEVQVHQFLRSSSGASNQKGPATKIRN
jgi:hypothetical protein